MIYFAKFDNVGNRGETYAADGMPYTFEDLQAMDGFLEINEADFKLYCSGEYLRGTDGKPQQKPVLEPQPTEQEHSYVDPSTLTIMEAIAAQEERLRKLEGGVTA